MRVFHQIVVLGVGAAITFSSVGQSASAQPAVQSQGSQPNPSPVPNNPNSISVPNFPVPATRVTPTESFPPVTPKGILETQPPRSLEPNPNPLLFPTQPDDVRIEQTQAITLQQAVDLARRNSKTLQVADLQVQQSRSALREQKAALYPDLNFQMNASRSVSAGGELGVRANQRRLNFQASQAGDRKSVV